MKRIAFIIVLLLSLVPSLQAQREFYERYATRDDLEAVYVHGYLLDSVNRIDVVLLQANDSAAWEWMMEEFSVPPLSEKGKRELAEGKDSKFIQLVDNIENNSDIPSCVMIGSRKERYMCVFFLETPEQFQWILRYYAKILSP